MAKSNSFFGLRRGSTKTLTFQVNGGQQITKDRVSVVRNPRTPAMMTQRMVMATASAAYAAFKTIVDHSFAGIVYGQPTMSEFISVNAKLLRDALTSDVPNFQYNAYQSRAVQAGAYQMSRGSLESSLVGRGVLASAPYLLHVLGEDDEDNWAAIGIEGGSVTPARLSELFGIPTGGYVTICVAFADNSGAFFANSRFGFVRLHHNASTDPITLGTTSDAHSAAAAAIASALSVEVGGDILEGFVVSGTTAGNNGLRLDVTTSGDTEGVVIIGHCIIRSQQVNGQWERSTEYMTIPANILEDGLNTPAYSLATYPLGQSYVLNGGDAE